MVNTPVSATGPNRRLRRALLLAPCLLLLIRAEAMPPSGEQWVHEALESVKINIESRKLALGSIAVSPDGKDIAYSVLNSRISQNQSGVDFVLASRSDLSPSAKPTVLRSITGGILDAQLYPQFSPDGKSLAFLAAIQRGVQHASISWAATHNDAIAVRDLATGEVSIAGMQSISKKALGRNFEASSLRTFRWSPDGTQLAAIVQGQFDRQLNTGTEISVEDSYPMNPSAAPARLAVYNIADKKWSVLGPPSINVDSFDWAPDGRSIALSGSEGQENRVWGLKTAIYLLQVATGEIRALVPSIGTNFNPRWSPDGRWIAFQTKKGQPRLLDLGRLGLYELRSGAVTYPAYEELGRISGNMIGTGANSVEWAVDSRSVFVDVPHDVSQRIFTISIPDGTLKQFTNDNERELRLVQSDARKDAIFFTRESFLEPPELYVSPSNRFDPRQVTAVGENPILKGTTARKLSWPSRDGKWTIHGWLLLPSAEVAANPLPLLVDAVGGPVMVSPNTYVPTFPLQAFLSGGVAVLIPNSRGRGGYSTDFEYAWESERDCGQGPMEDDLAGVEMLVKEGIADPDRVALAGHSWGGYLAAYALTHTDRFKAVLIHEAVQLDPERSSLFGIGNPQARAINRQFGLGSLFEAGEKERLDDLSPVLQAGRATTPSLLEFGAESLIQDGTALFQSLKYFDRAPTELISYPNSGHSIEGPALKYDSARRELEWFAYWVLGKPTQRMLDRYGPPHISQWSPSGSVADRLLR
jgi:dipeptidyl aminopeptidase/acylaminoacyl peptidase